MTKLDAVRYVYHAVPEPMLGATLYPLNALRVVHPVAYEYAVQKYNWRKSFLEMVIPKLNCLWNDVLHFTVIHPNTVYQELKAAGMQSDRSVLFFEVPVEMLSHLPYAMYQTPKPTLVESSYSVDSQAPELLIDPNNVKLAGEYDFAYPEFPNETREYFKFEYSRGRRPLVFNGLPHFLLHSPIETIGLRQVDWRDAP